MKTIGAVTFHASHNYGSVLQAFALQEYVKSNFDEIEYKIINLRIPEQHAMFDFPNKKATVKTRIMQTLYYKSLMKKYEKFEYFINNYLNVTREYSCIQEIEEKFDIYISAGDQIWNPRCKDFSWLYYLDSINNAKKISFSPSMGPNPRFTDEEKLKAGELLDDYFSIGVREIGTKEVVEQLLTIRKEINVMPDPVLLLKKEQWISLLKNNNVRNTTKKKFIFFYALKNCNNRSYTSVKKVKRIMGIPVIVSKCLKRVDYFHYYENHFDAGPFDFLNYIYETELVIATSFHACVFSSILHKPFIALDVMNDNRIQGFLETYGLKSHNVLSQNLTKDMIEYQLKNVDYSYFDDVVKTKQKEAYDWFAKNLI